MLKPFLFLLHIELILLIRRSQEWIYPLGFFLIIVSLFPLAFSPDPAFLQKYIAGCIWFAALLASLLSMQNIYASDTEDAHLEQLLLSEHPLTLLIAAKLFAQWLVTELPLIILTPLLGMIFNLPSEVYLTLSLSLLLGTPILTLLGAFISALTLGLRQQGVLLGILILPLATPVLIFGVAIVQQLQNGFAITGPIAFLAGISLLAILFLPVVIAVTLQLSSDH